jgi:formylglycine-generating enzyme required for sulfatase activity
MKCHAGPNDDGISLGRDQVGKNNSKRNDCGSRWDNKQTAVGSFAPNRSGLYDTVGKVWEWTEDYYLDGSSGASGGRISLDRQRVP